MKAEVMPCLRKIIILIRCEIKDALKQCGYSGWAFQKPQPKSTKASTTTPISGKKTESKLFPYMSRVCRSVSFKAHQTLRSCLVHRKDKRDISQICDCVYGIFTTPQLQQNLHW